MQKTALCGWSMSLTVLSAFRLRSTFESGRYITKTLMVMKITSILFLAACLQVSAHTMMGQKITLQIKNASLRTVFNAIEEQTGFILMYADNVLADTKPVSVKADNTPLEEFLQLILQDQPIEYTIVKRTILLSRKEKDDADLRSITEILAPPGSVEGKIMDEDGKPLSGANVIVKGVNNQGTSTDINGYYQIANVAVGKYTLVVSFVGYATKTVTINIIDDKTVSLNFTLSTSLVNLDQLTVTSTLSARKIREYPATIAVIKQEDLKNRNINNIANVLETVPGIIIQPGSELGNSGNTRIPSGLFIRGTSGTGSVGIKYLIDGIEVVTAGTSYGMLQTLDPNDIEKIEVLKGPMASTLYGSGAGGGVISITTKKGKPGKTHLNFKTMFTEYANDYTDNSGYSQNYSANVSGGNEQFNYLLSAGYNLYPLTKLSDTSNGIDDKTWSYSAKIGGKAKNFVADLSLQYGSERSGFGSTAISDNKYRASLGLSTYPTYPLDDYRNSQRNFSSVLHLNHTLANNWYHDMTVGYNIMNSITSDNTMSSDGTYSILESLASRMNLRYFMFYEHPWSKILKSSITMGLEYNNFDVRNMSLSSTTALTDFLTATTPAVANSATYTRLPYSSTGYFAEAVTGLRNNLFLTTSIRFDVNAAYGESVGGYPQPRVGLSYVIEKDKFKIKPRVVWGVSSDAPDPRYKKTYTIIDMYSINNYIGNLNIKPQRSEGYEFGADIFYGGNYSLNITYYDQKLKDMILSSSTYDFNVSPIVSTNYFYNIAKAINKGLEVSAKAIIRNFTLDLSYTATTSKWGDVTGQLPNVLVHPGAPNLGVPKRSIFARLSYTTPSLLPWTKKGGRISFDWRYNGSAYSFDEIGYSLATDAWNNLPDPKPDYPNYTSYYVWQKAYSNFNLRADHSITNFAALYVDVQNLLDKQGSINGQSMARFPGRRINFGFNLTF